MAPRCIIIERPFGSRDPLRPRIASLDEDSDVSTVLTAARDLCPLNTKKSARTKLNLRNLGTMMEHDNVNLHPVLQDTSAASSGCAGAPSSSSSALSTYSTTGQRSSTASNSSPTTLDSSINEKESDVAAFGSQAVHANNPVCTDIITIMPGGIGNHPHGSGSIWRVQSALAPTHGKGDEPHSVLASIMEHTDILDTLMLNCPDFPTLFALVTSCKAAKRVFEQRPVGIIKEMLKTMPQELQDLTTALIGINGCHIGTSRSIKRHMEIWLGMRPKPLMGRLRIRPIEIVGKLARSFSAIDFFMKVIPKNCESNFEDYKTVLASRVGLNHADITNWSSKHPLLQQTEWSDVPDDTEWDVPSLPPSGSGPQAICLPLNDREMYRLKRALLRYELFCAIFYLGPDRHFDAQRYPQLFGLVPETCKKRAFCKDQVKFLEEYVNPWEIGELAVVSHFMFDLVRNAYFRDYMVLRYNEAHRSLHGQWGNKDHGRNRHEDHEEVVDEFGNHVVWFASQGLTLLRKIYNDRKGGYQALVEKYGKPRYRAAELFVPFQKCADRLVYDYRDPYASWTPRQTWADTLGMEQPSKGWLAKSPASEDQWWEDAYWGDKWTRKMGYFIWDRD